MTQNKCERLQGGFTLVELMVAMLISLLLMGGVIQVFSSSSKSYRNHEGLSRIQENGRFAMEFLTRDIRMADFWGCANNVSKVTNNLNYVASSPWDFSEGLRGTDGGGLNGSDSIRLRGAFGTGLYIQPPYGPTTSASLKVPPNTILSVGDIFLVTNCESADVAQVTGQVTGTNVSLTHNSGAGTPGNSTHTVSTVYGPNSQVYGVRTSDYSIALGADGQPALFRSINGAAGLELVDGVREMQILFGEDTDGDLTANYYVIATSVADWEQVVSVKVWLLLQSYEDNLASSPMTYTDISGATQTAPDNRLYQVFNSTIAVRNRVQ
jgi:type IV pilus assembly protein PilW